MHLYYLFINNFFNFLQKKQLDNNQNIVLDLTIELENVNPDDTIFTIQPDEMKVDETNYTVREANAPVGLKRMLLLITIIQNR